MTVYEDQVLSPRGGEGIYAWVDVQDAAAVVAVTAEEEIVLVGQARYPIEEYSWEIIEGGIEENEDPLETARRELLEEGGITAESIEPLGPVYHMANTRSRELVYIFLARGLTFDNNDPDDTELLTIKRVPVDEFFELVDRGVIRDSISVVAAHRYRDLLRKG